MADFRPYRRDQRFGEIGRVFPPSKGAEAFSARLVRLAVLYEDLRIEVFAAGAEPHDMERLETLSTIYRQQYFIRRAIATTFEFSQAIDKLRECEEMKLIEERTADSKDYLLHWLPATQFFKMNYSSSPKSCDWNQSIDDLREQCFSVIFKLE